MIGLELANHIYIQYILSKFRTHASWADGPVIRNLAFLAWPMNMRKICTFLFRWQPARKRRFFFKIIATQCEIATAHIFRTGLGMPSSPVIELDLRLWNSLSTPSSSITNWHCCKISLERLWCNKCGRCRKNGLKKKIVNPTAFIKLSSHFIFLRIAGMPTESLIPDFLNNFL